MASDTRKPQPTTTSLSLSPPATAMTPVDLEPAMAALTAKKQRLRESFDRLVAACSPVPIPFLWEDIDAHLSSVQAALAFRFASPHHEFATEGPTTVAERLQHSVEHRVQRGEREEVPESNAVEGEEANNAPVVQEHDGSKGEARAASDACRVQEGDEAGNEREEGAIEVSTEQDAEEEVSKGPREAMDASPRQDDDDDSEEEGEVKWPRRRDTAAGSGEKALARNIAAACANMDASMLVGMLCQSCRNSLPARRAFLPALLGAADPHALVIRAVEGFLARSECMTYRSWGHCVALLECVPHLTGTVRPSADTLEQAERLVLDWKEMLVGKTGSCRDISRLAGWGLFTFLASYNISLEFEADEIIRLFDNLPPRLKENCIELCKRLGLIEKMTDSIHHLIGNGQPLDAIRLACALNLTDKCPLSLMYDYVDKANRAAEEILSKERDSPESLNHDMARNVNALMLAWTAVDECNIDSVHRNNIKKEISQLLHKYADKQRSLAGVPAFLSTSHQQHNLQEQCLMQLEMTRDDVEEPKGRVLQQNPGKKNQRQQPKTYKSHQKQHQNQQEGWGWQDSTWRSINKNQKRKQGKKKWQFNKHPRFSSHPYSGIQGVTFAERAKQT